jgi:hypothetical protein
MPTRSAFLIPVMLAGALLTGCAAPEPHRHSAPTLEPSAMQTHGQPADHAAAAGTRQLVNFPDAMRTHTLANMRDHLLALAQIQEALATGAHDKAAEIAEQRLGMTSLKAHGAHESARFMPQGMQAIGTAMHQGASRFAIEAQNASASGDLKPALAALARTTQACVACHAGYRMQ